MNPLLVSVKICGITRLSDAQLAVELGASAIGFILYKPSPRYIEPERIAGIVAELPPYVATVGVFVNESVEHMNRVVGEARVDRIQLHGDEPFALMSALSRPAYRALRLKSAADIDAVEAGPDKTVMLDTYLPDKFGGTGRAFDWSWASRIAATLHRQGRRVILAGGLSSDTVGQAIRDVQPYAVDVSSGVEASPGIKDENKLRALFRALETADASDPTRSRHAVAT